MRREITRGEPSAAKPIMRCTAVLLLALVAACASPDTERLLAGQAAHPEKTEIIGVPFFPQEEAYCGPASLASVLAWSGLSVTQTEIAAQVYTAGRGGTLQSDMLGAARRNGRLAVPIDSLVGIFREVSVGRPVLVFQNLAFDWYPKWHYAVVYGYDLDAGTVLLHSGEEERHVSDLDGFARSWRRGGSWAVVVLPPDKLPVEASERTLLAAAAALSRAEQEEAAETAFAAIAARWPDSVTARLGLGNARFTQQKYHGAERAFRAAIERAPRNADAWNNLAYALARQGRHADAVAAARKAVAFGAPGNATYRDTLNEIGGGRTL